MNNPQQKNRPRKSRKRWAAYASAASAALVSAQSGTVEGAIVDIAPASFGSGAFLANLDGVGGNDAGFNISVNNSFQNAGLSFVASGGTQVPMSNDFNGGGGPGTLASGSRRTSNFPTTSFPTTSFPTTSFFNAGFPTNITKTFGLTLASGNNAWIQVRLNTGFLNEFTSWEILNGAYESVVGEPIHVGTNAIPEPSTLALLGLAAAGGVAALRKRRQQPAA